MSQFGMNAYNPAASLQGLYQGQGGMAQGSTSGFPFNAQDLQQQKAFWGEQQTQQQGPPIDPAVLAYLNQPQTVVHAKAVEPNPNQKLVRNIAIVVGVSWFLNHFGIIGGGNDDETPVKPAVKTTIFTRQAQTELDNIKTETWAFQSTDSAKGAVAQYERDASHLFAVYQMKLTEFAGNTAALAKLDKDFAPVREQIQKQHDAIQKQIAEKGWDKDVTIKSPDALYKEVTTTMQADKAAGDAAVVKYDAALKQLEDWVKVKADKVALEKAKTFAQDQIKLLDAEIEAEQAGAKRMGVKMALIRTRDKFQQHVGAITTALGQPNNTTPKGNTPNITTFSADAEVKGIQEGFNKANDLVATARKSTGNAETDRKNWEAAKAEVALQLAAAKVVEGKKADELKNEASAVIQKLTALQTEITDALGALPKNTDPIVGPAEEGLAALRAEIAGIKLDDLTKVADVQKALVEKAQQLQKDIQAKIESKMPEPSKDQATALTALKQQASELETKGIPAAVLAAKDAAQAAKDRALIEGKAAEDKARLAKEKKAAQEKYKNAQLNLAYLEQRKTLLPKENKTALDNGIATEKTITVDKKADKTAPASASELTTAKDAAKEFVGFQKIFNERKDKTFTAQAEAALTLAELRQLKRDIETAQKGLAKDHPRYQEDLKALLESVNVKIEALGKLP